jgi:hypothetical protein
LCHLHFRLPGNHRSLLPRYSRHSRPFALPSTLSPFLLRLHTNLTPSFHHHHRCEPTLTLFRLVGHRWNSPIQAKHREANANLVHEQTHERAIKDNIQLRELAKQLKRLKVSIEDLKKQLGVGDLRPTIAIERTFIIVGASLPSHPLAPFVHLGVSACSKPQSRSLTHPLYSNAVQTCNACRGCYEPVEIGCKLGQAPRRPCQVGAPTA